MCSSTRGPAMAPSLVTWPTRKTARAALLRQAQEAAGRLAHLGHAARRRRELVAVEGLHGVDDDHRRPRRLDGREDRLELGLGEDADAAGPPRQMRSARILHLRRRLLAADEQRRAVGGDRVEHLQQQRALADARLAADEDERARHDAAAQHAVELVDAR